MKVTLEEFVRVFVDEGDPDLMTSKCGCCEEKRQLVKRLRDERDEEGKSN